MNLAELLSALRPVYAFYRFYLKQWLFDLVLLLRNHQPKRYKSHLVFLTSASAS